MLADILSITKTTVDLILVNSCGLQELNKVHDMIQSQSMLFDSRIRGTFKDHTKYEGKGRPTGKWRRALHSFSNSGLD